MMDMRLLGTFMSISTVPGTIDPASPVGGSSIAPFITRVVTFSTASLPPIACTYLSRIWSTVGAAADAWELGAASPRAATWTRTNTIAARSSAAADKRLIAA